MLRVSSNDSVRVFHGIGALRGGLEVISWKGHHLTSFLFGGGIIHPWKRHHKKLIKTKYPFFNLCFSHSPFVMDHNLHEVAYMKQPFHEVTQRARNRLPRGSWSVKLHLVSQATLFYRNQSLPCQLIKAIKTVSRDEKFIFRENFSFNLKACICKMHASFFI